VKSTILDSDFYIKLNKSAFGNNGFGDELYLVTGETSILTVDANTLELKNTFTPTRKVKEMATNNNEIFATSYERKVKLYQRYDFNNEFDLAPYGNNYGLEFSNDVTNRLIQIGKTEIHAYDLNDLGVLLNHSFQFNPYQTNWVNNNLIMSPSGKYIANNSKEVFDSNLNPIAKLESPYS